MNRNLVNRFFITAAILWNDREDCECQDKSGYSFENTKVIFIFHL